MYTLLPCNYSLVSLTLIDGWDEFTWGLEVCVNRSSVEKSVSASERERLILRLAGCQNGAGQHRAKIRLCLADTSDGEVHATVSDDTSSLSTYESVDAQQNKVDGDGDRLVAVHHCPRHSIVVVEQIRQQAFLVRRIAKRERRCSSISNRITLHD